MKEVSCRIFQFLCQILRQKGHPVERLFEGTGLTTESIRDPNERFDWKTYQQVERNFVSFFKDEELLEIGGICRVSPHLFHLAIIPRLLFTARDLYFWIFKPVTGAGVQLFSSVQPYIRDLDKNTLLLE